MTGRSDTSITDLRQALLEAAQRQDVSALTRLTDELFAIPNADLAPLGELLLAIARLHHRQQDFARAAQVFDRIPNLPDAVRFERNFVCNLAALRLHRPGIFEQIISLPQPSVSGIDYAFVNGPDQRVLLARVRPNDPGAQPTLMAPGAQFQPCIDAIEKQVAANPNSPLVLGGIGDGYVISHLAANPHELFMDQQLAVFLLEPDPRLLRACLQLHDWSGGDGPIADRRFQVFVGEDWPRQVEAALDADPYLYLPRGYLCLEPDRAPFDAAITALVDSRGRQQQADIATAQAHYDARDEEELIRVLGDDPPRKPRVLFITTRFSTVLQYATRDTRRAFDELGWETRLLIEQERWQLFNSNLLAREVAAFKPDVIFQIDWLRGSSPVKLMPRQILHFCWIQDFLPQLTAPDAHTLVGERDFVLTFATPRFIDQHHYPAQQVIDMPMMLTLEPEASPDQAEDDAPRDDFLYVSNVSGTADEHIEQMLSRVPDKLKPVASRAAGSIVSTYEADGNLPTHHHLRQVLAEAMRREGVNTIPDQWKSQLIDQLWNPLNSGLYRQQALGWVADLAEERGLSLAVYGRGWENHPRFARYARGVIPHGRPLAAATRNATFALHLEPYACFTHHRMLDALMAGGFVLARAHPGNHLLQRIANSLREHVDPNFEADGDPMALPQTNDAALAACDPAHRDTLRALLDEGTCLPWDEKADAVRQVRCWQRAGVLAEESDTVPHLDDVSFTDATSLRGRVEALIDDTDRRTAIAAAQRQTIAARLTFPVAFQRVIREVRARLQARRAGATS